MFCLFSRNINRFVALFLLSLSCVSSAAPLSEADKEAISAAFTTNFPQINVMSVSDTVFDGVFELLLDNSESVYVNRAADHMLVGAKHLEIKGPGQVVDVTEQRKSVSRKSAIAHLDVKEAVVFEGEGEKTTPIYVFTDVDCGYCRKLHEEVPELQKAGIEVQYYAWPRAGVKSSAGTKMHNVWCAEDQQVAMTVVKSGGSIPAAKEGCKSPLAEQLKLGVKLGVAGTPAIFTESGRQIGGYAKAQDLIKLIREE